MAQHEFKNRQTVMSRLIDAHGQVDPQTRASIMKVYAPKYGEAAVDGVIKRYFYGSLSECPRAATIRCCAGRALRR